MIDSMEAEPLESPEDGGAMTDQELAALLAEHESRSVGYFTSEIADDQAKAIDYYYGRPFGDERAGRSSVVDRTVAVTVDNALAALLKPFVSAEDVVSYAPRGPEDEQVAEQATEYVNYVFQCDNPGFTILHSWFKDALLTKLGVVKFWWEDKTRQEVQKKPVDAPGLLEARQSEGYLNEEDHGDGTFTVSHQVEIPDGQVRIENVPPEEFLISPLSRTLAEAPYVAHRPSNVTRSILLEMGLDPEVVESLPAYTAGRNEESRSQSRYQDEEWSSGARVQAGNDKSQDVIGLLDEYIRVDYDGDGISELRRVIRANDVILLNEVVDKRPFALLCPVPMPHKVIGLSLADQALDLQRIASVVWRQTLDNLYLSNNPRPQVLNSSERSDGSTLEDLQDDAPGSIIRVASTPIEWMEVPFAADKSFPMLAFIGEQVEARTGVRRGGNGLDRNSLNKSAEMTALQAAQIEAKENERVEMIARIFAETGITDLFKGLLDLVSKYQPKSRIIRLRNKWVEIDPRGWPEMDVRVNVGLGVGNKMDQIAQADAVLETMAELQDTPYAYLIDAEKVYNALKRKFQATGIKNVDDFLLDPKEAQPPEPQPDPEMAKVQLEGQKAQAAHQLNTQKAGAELEQSQTVSAAKLEQMRQEAALKLQLERDKATAQIVLDRERMQAEMDLARERQVMEMHLAEQDAQRKHEITMNSLSTNRPGGDLDK